MNWRGLLALSISMGAIAVDASGGCSSLELSQGTGGGATGGSGPTIFTTSSGTGGSSVSSGGTGGSGGLGVAEACASDGECRTGLTCLLDTDAMLDPIFGGGPVDGFCTRACGDDDECGEPGAVCFKLDPTQPGRCTLSCTIGPPIKSTADLFAPLSADKCRGREDVRCGKAKDGVGVCLPTCGEDSQCHGGHVCDPRLAVCVDHPNDGLPLGASCNPTDDPTPCGGLCVGFESGVGMCSSPCVLGGDEQSSADCGGIDRGFCAFRPQANGPGDVGFCTPSCKVQADCASPNFWCFTVPGLSELSQRGYCFTAAPCPNGQADCDAYTQCTDTPSGRLCLDAAYPLDGTGGAGGGTP